MIPPSAFSVTVSKFCFVFIPKPIITGFFRGNDEILEKYFSFFKTAFWFPVVDEELTAYRKPELKESR